ncbi:hypothetical protein TW95_gp0609 [Pandoravirus inopinatum]|uniref:Uncharacterized protein n=1 Tax=Pandoravirus inopinatum TaxID=1605721 RepID=A0A0B5IX78_9VIRU|nr:hypothetical protein TW95_gp0609 [Pandoravirus inopinatum]AJF97343.1 hypothetical protein [Pandoravirus inopinatum]
MSGATNNKSGGGHCARQQPRQKNKSVPIHRPAAPSPFFGFFGFFNSLPFGKMCAARPDRAMSPLCVTLLFPTLHGGKAPPSHVAGSRGPRRHLPFFYRLLARPAWLSSFFFSLTAASAPAAPQDRTKNCVVKRAKK